MKNMKTAKKLAVSFSIVIVLAIIVGVIGIVGMKTINDADDKLYNENLRAVSEMGEIRDELQRQRVITRDFTINAGNEQKLQDLEKNLAASESAMEEFLAAYEKTIVNQADETAYFNALEIYRNEYNGIKQRIVAASRISTQAAMAELYEPSASAVITDMVAGFTVSMDNNNAWAKNQVDANTNLFTRMMITEIAVLAIAIFIAIFLIFYISALISKPLNFMRDVLRMMGLEGIVDFSDEEYRQAEKFAKSKDETGESIKMLIQTGRHLEQVGQSLKTVASGDLTAELALLSERDTIGIALKEMLDNLNSMFGDIRTASEQVSSGAGQVSQGAQELASGSSEQAASIEELSNSLSQLQEKTDNNAKASGDAREANNTTAARLRGSIQSMSEMLEAMREIDSSSQNITRVIKVIDDIAFQTNILALNAAVEAARAGQHGKGFAVVADEVRNLAAKSAEAAKETSALIEGSSERVKQGNEIVEKTNSDLEAAVESAQESTRLIEQVAGASIEQAKSITGINQGMEQISTVVQANSATAEQSAAASEEMSAQAIVMNDIVARFKLKGDISRNTAHYDSMNPSNKQAQNYGQSNGSRFALSGEKY